MTDAAAECVQLLKDLIRIPSVNPQARETFTDPFGEHRMNNYVQQWFEDCGFNVQRETIRPGRDNLIVQTPGADTSKTLMLCAHSDTVGVEDMSIEPFDPIEKEGRLYGRGSCDTKASLACMMIAFRERVHAGRLPANLCLLVTCGEEYDMPGSRHYAAHYHEQLAGVIFGEPTCLLPVIAHKGDIRLKVSTIGRSAHSSRPEVGRNAIYAMTPLLRACESFHESLDRDHPLLGRESLVVTQIQGGHQVNVIPDQCWTVIDWRLLPGRDQQGCLDELHHCFEQAGVNAQIDEITWFAPLQTALDAPMVHCFQQALSATGHDSTPQGVTYATDGSSFAHLDIPMLVFGPGDIAQAHTRDEWIDLPHIPAALNIYRTYLNSDWGI